MDPKADNGENGDRAGPKVAHQDADESGAWRPPDHGHPGCARGSVRGSSGPPGQGLRMRPLRGHSPICVPLSPTRRTSERPTRNPPSRSGACRRLRRREAAWSYRKAPFHLLKALPCLRRASALTVDDLHGQLKPAVLVAANGSRGRQRRDRGTEALVILRKLRFNDAIASKLMPIELLKGKYARVLFAVLFLYCTFPENTEPAATGQGVVSAEISAPTGERPSRARRGSPR